MVQANTPCRLRRRHRQRHPGSSIGIPHHRAFGPPTASNRTAPSSSTLESRFSADRVRMSRALPRNSLSKSSSSLSCTTARIGFLESMHLLTARLNSGLTSSIGPTSSMTTNSDDVAAASKPAAPISAKSVRLTLYLPTLGPSFVSTEASSPFLPDERSRTSNPIRVPFERRSYVVHPPTITPALFRRIITFETSVDFPTPGGPVTSQIPPKSGTFPSRST